MASARASPAPASLPPHPKALWSVLLPPPRQHHRLRLSAAPITGVDFDEEENSLLTGGVDGKLRLWKFGQRKNKKLREEEEDQERSYGDKAEGQSRLRLGKGAVAGLGHKTDHSRLFTFPGHEGPVHAVSYAPSGDLLASGSRDRTIRTWKPSISGTMVAQSTQSASVLDVCFSPDGSFLAAALADKSVKLFSSSSLSFHRSFLGHSNWVRSVAFSPAFHHYGALDRPPLRQKRSFLSSGADEHGEFLTGHRRGRKIATMPAIEGRAIHRHAESERGLTTLRDEEEQGYEEESRNHHARDLEPRPRIQTNSQSRPGNPLLASAGDDKTVRLWDPVMGRCVNTYYDCLATVEKVIFHPDGTAIAACGADKAINIWDVRSRRLAQHYPESHSDIVTSISFHASGNFLLSCANDGVLKLWDVREGRLLYSINPPATLPLSCCAFSRHGDLFASGDVEGHVSLLDSNLRFHISAAERERSEQMRQAMTKNHQRQRHAESEMSGESIVKAEAKSETKSDEVGHRRGANGADEDSLWRIAYSSGSVLNENNSRAANERPRRGRGDYPDNGTSDSGSSNNNAKGNSNRNNNNGNSNNNNNDPPQEHHMDNSICPDARNNVKEQRPRAKQQASYVEKEYTNVGPRATAGGPSFSSLSFLTALHSEDGETDFNNDAPRQQSDQSITTRAKEENHRELRDPAAQQKQETRQQQGKRQGFVHKTWHGAEQEKQLEQNQPQNQPQEQEQEQKQQQNNQHRSRKAAYVAQWDHRPPHIRSTVSAASQTPTRMEENNMKKENISPARSTEPHDQDAREAVRRDLEEYLRETRLSKRPNTHNPIPDEPASFMDPNESSQSRGTFPESAFWSPNESSRSLGTFRESASGGLQSDVSLSFDRPGSSTMDAARFFSLQPSSLPTAPLESTGSARGPSSSPSSSPASSHFSSSYSSSSSASSTSSSLFSSVISSSRKPVDSYATTSFTDRSKTNSSPSAASGSLHLKLKSVAERLSQVSAGLAAIDMKIGAEQQKLRK